MRSSVEIFDMASGTPRVVFQTERLIEAPNWHPDGRLLVNGDGHLFTLALDGDGGLQPVDTDFADQCNNDHGYAPDGTQIVISHHLDRQSCIFTLPAGGGVPRRVTENTPSYWHGWSPDGARLAYCARRNDAYDIFTIGVEGGAETRLTDGPGHKDGPDYSPDGAWIWYNSDETGHAQIWKMRADGRDKQQMTFDERVNWFPHPSPNGRDVLYLAYPSGTVFHPRDLPCELRMISVDGGAPRILVHLFGGQGSINVPCWAPDGHAFAFMRYFAQA